MGSADLAESRKLDSSQKSATPFSTPSGKAILQRTPIPDLRLPEPRVFNVGPEPDGIVLALMTGHSYSQHNTVVYQTGDRYRGMPHRHCILLNRLDAERLGVVEHGLVTVQGDVGQMETVAVIYGAVRIGAALMFYPEVNAIFSARIEPRSGTPAYKRVPVYVYKPQSPDAVS